MRGDFITPETPPQRWALAKAGGTMIASAKQVALLHDQRARAQGDGATVSSGLFVGAASSEKEFTTALGIFRRQAGVARARDAWTTRALLEVL